MTILWLGIVDTHARESVLNDDVFEKSMKIDLRQYGSDALTGPTGVGYKRHPRLSWKLNCCRIHSLKRQVGLFRASACCAIEWKAKEKEKIGSVGPS
jgi:hypothetical protein